MYQKIPAVSRSLTLHLTSSSRCSLGALNAHETSRSAAEDRDESILHYKEHREIFFLCFAQPCTCKHTPLIFTKIPRCCTTSMVNDNDFKTLIDFFVLLFKDSAAKSKRSHCIPSFFSSQHLG